MRVEWLFDDVFSDQLMQEYDADDDGKIGPAESDAETRPVDEVAAGGGEALLIWRQGIAVFHRVTDAAEAAALDRVADGTTFGAICEALCEDRPEQEAATQAFAWLSTWTADELLVAV